MKFCEICGEEIGTKDGENRCPKCENAEEHKTTLAARRAQRKAREAALASCGLVKVRGALGGTYWE